MDTSTRTTSSAKRPTWSAGRVADIDDEAALPADDADAAVGLPEAAEGMHEAAEPPETADEMPTLERLRTPVPSARKRGSRAVSRLMVVGVFVLVGGLAFAIGRTTVGSNGGTQQNAAQQGFPGGLGPNASGAPGGFGERGAGGGLTVQGTVESVANGTITVKLSNGQTVQVATSSSTTYHGQTAASETDVTAGKTVTIAVEPGSVPAPASSAGTGTTGTTRTASSVTIAGN